MDEGIKSATDDLDALLADLQNTSQRNELSPKLIIGGASDPPPPLNNNQSNRQQSATSTAPNQMASSVTSVEKLLDDLDKAHPSITRHTSRPEGRSARLSSSDQVTTPSLAIAPTVQAASSSASSATRELDELMASLSDFKVQQQRAPSDVSLPDASVGMATADLSDTETGESTTDSQSGAEDYATINKMHNPGSPTDRLGEGAFSGSEQPSQNLDSMLGSLQTNMTKQGVTTVTKGTCAACNKPIIGQVCTALGKTWHPEHFACCICETQLGTQTFFERDGKPYCEEDYHEKFAPKCHGCNGPILDSCVTSMDKTWHPHCFVCTECKKPFGESGFHEKEGKAYCRDDYFKMFAPKCSGCNQAIIDNYISALNGHWHPQCFVCMECHQPFQGGSFFEHEGMPYCEMHYHARRGSLCYSCQKPITGRCITAMHRKFHPEHFICAFCLKQLNKGTFKEQNDKPYCHPCYVKLFG